jgi:hypothetical protein
MFYTIKNKIKLWDYLLISKNRKVNSMAGWFFANKAHWFVDYEKHGVKSKISLCKKHLISQYCKLLKDKEVEDFRKCAECKRKREKEV